MKFSKICLPSVLCIFVAMHINPIQAKPKELKKKLDALLLDPNNDERFNEIVDSDVDVIYRKDKPYGPQFRNDHRNAAQPAEHITSILAKPTNHKKKLDELLLDPLNEERFNALDSDMLYRKEKLRDENRNAAIRQTTTERADVDVATAVVNTKEKEDGAKPVQPVQDHLRRMFGFMHLLRRFLQ